MKKFLVIFMVVLGISSLLFAVDEIKVGGGGAAGATVVAPVKAAFDKASGMSLIPMATTPKDGFEDLVNGKTDAAAAAVSLQSMIDGAAKDGVTIDPAKLKTIELAKNETVLMVHPSNKVNGLTSEQIQGIFSGKITNWKDVGGDDRMIMVVWGKNTPGQNAGFIKNIMKDNAVTKEFLEATNYASIRQVVGSTPEAIGFDPKAIATDDSVKIIGSPELNTTPIILVTVGDPSDKVQKFIDFIKSDAGQKIIQETVTVKASK